MKHFIKFRVLPMILALVLSLGVMTVGISAFAAANPYDVNADGDVTIADVTALLDLLSEEGSEVVDLNNDGAMTIADVTALLDYLSGDIPEETMEDIVNAAYALEIGASMAEQKTLTGVVTSIDFAYSSNSASANPKSITVTMIVGALTDKPIKCYKLIDGEGIAEGEGIALVAVGDTITVTGTLKNYNGTIEFDANCTLDELVISEVSHALANVTFDSPVNSGDEVPAPLADSTYSSVFFEYSAQTAAGDPAPVTFENGNAVYGDVTEVTEVVITVAASDGEETMTMTFTVTVYPAGQGETMQDIVDAAYALTGSETLEGKTLTGKIIKIDTPYSADNKNITVTIVVEGREDKPIQCYRLKGAEANGDTPAVDISELALLDTITVTGTLKNYKGTIEFDQNCVCSEIVPTDSDVGLALMNNVNFESTYNSGDGTDAMEEDDEYPGVYYTYEVLTADGGAAPVTIEDDWMTFGDVTEATPITITVTATDGVETLTRVFNVTILPEGQEETMEDVVNAAYALAVGESMSEAKTLTGVITAVNTAYNSQFGNVTVTIQIGDLTDKLIQCYRMKNGANITTGAGVEVIKIGDTITVTGILKRYSATVVEFDANCTLDSFEPYVLPDAEKVLFERDALSVTPANGTELPAAGTTYTDVAIAWASSNSTVVSIVDGVIVVDNSTLTETAEITLTATLSLNGASQTKTFTIVVTAPAGEDAEPKTWTLTFPSGNQSGNTSYTGTFEAVIDGQTWSLYGFNNGGTGTSAWSVIRTGRKSDALVSTITTTISGTVETVVLHLTQVNAEKTNSIKLYVLNGTAELAVVSIDSVTTGDHTFIVPTSAQASGLTYKLEFDLQADGNANGSTRLDQVTYNGYVGGESLPPACTHSELTGVTYTWASDYSTCTATGVCANCEETVTETGTASVLQHLDGVSYVVTFTNAAFEQQSVTVPSTDPTVNTTSIDFSQDYAEHKNTGYANEWTWNDWTLTGFANNNGQWAYMKTGQKKASKDDPDKVTTNTIVISGENVDHEVSTVTVYIGEKYGASNTVDISVTATGNGVDTTVTKAFGDFEFGTASEFSELTFSFTGDEYDTYTVTFVCTNTTTSNGVVQVFGVTLSE